MGMRKNQGQFSAPHDDNFDAFGGQSQKGRSGFPQAAMRR
jgi:hypothetical protein